MGSNFVKTLQMTMRKTQAVKCRRLAGQKDFPPKKTLWNVLWVVCGCVGVWLWVVCGVWEREERGGGKDGRRGREEERGVRVQSSLNQKLEF